MSGKKKHIGIWGSTGSIGRQTLDVIGRSDDRFDVRVLTAHRNSQLLYQQAERFRPKLAVIAGDVDPGEWQSRFKKIGVDLLFGKSGLLTAAEMQDVDLAVNGLVGAVGLEVTLRALRLGTSIALANKEVLVMAGELVMAEARKQKASILPVDSEHSALFQCLAGEDTASVRRLILTASGGPFLHKSRSDLKQVTVREALDHPNWSMGKKVTIDSATMVNKGLEIIEARWLFDMDPDKIDVAIHPQSIIHSMVEFCDGSIKAQMGVPDMRTPIAYALTYPDRCPGDFGGMDFTQWHTLELLPPDTGKFPALNLASRALRTGGTAPAIFNGADEKAVELFLNGRIPFLRISELIAEALDNHEVCSDPTFDDIIRADGWAKQFVSDAAGSN